VRLVRSCFYSGALPPILTLLDVTVFSIEEEVFEILSTSHSGAFGSHYIGTNVTNHVASRLDYILHEDALKVSGDKNKIVARELYTQLHCDMIVSALPAC
jgi:hypothetical protein